MVEDTQAERVKSVGSALRLLQIIAASPHPISMRDAAEAADIPRATAYRLVGTLVAEGYILQDKDSQLLTVGYLVLPLAGNLLDKHRIRLAAMPYMEELAKAANIRVRIATMFRGKIFSLGCVERPDLPPIHSYFGTMTSPHSCALGKAMLAYMSDEELAEIVRISPLEARTENTITNFDTLCSELKTVKQQAFAIDNAEGALNQYCLSAPIWSRDGSLVAAISVMRRELDSVLLVKEEVLRCAERISHVV